jgi:hypothetical protein
MSASSITMYRSPKYIALYKRAAQDDADAKIGELSFSLRAKVRNVPTDHDDIHLSNPRLYYEAKGDKNPSEHFDSSAKILRLERRRLSRKLANI